MDMTIKPLKSREDADALLKSLGIPELPPAVADELANASRDEIACFVMLNLLELNAKLVRIVAAAASRCGVCRDSGQECAHCAAEGVMGVEILGKVAMLARIAQAATRPGSRIAAQMEAKREQNAAEAAERKE
jgi:hypothetical protein